MRLRLRQSLARRYRPAQFKELVGQDGAAKALTSALRLGRIPQGVLFTGVRGVGKTTTARLYAKALNCPHRSQDSEPCNSCDSCVAIAQGSHEDVLEIDGASNTSVNDIRSLQETILYAPQRSSYRVYIIDEVHMLSTAAFNALLKTLEEPPEHVVFVFATTELAKVPATIVGRCQTFHLSKLSIKQIRQRISEILAVEGIAAEDKAIGVIAREGHGSMRDALTLLDQAIAIGGGSVTLESLGPLVTKVSSTHYLNLLEAFIQKNAESGLVIIDALDLEGAVFSSAIEELAAFTRHAFIIRDLGTQAIDTALLGLDDHELSRIEQLVQTSAPMDLNRIFRTLVRCRSELDGSGIDRFIVENYFMEWCFDPGFPRVEELISGSSSKDPSSLGKLPTNIIEPTPRKSDSESSAKTHTPHPKPSLLDTFRQIPKETKVHTSTVQQPQPNKIASEPTKTDEKQFPETWRSLVDRWKRAKPLQARKLEETYPLRFSIQEIAIAVDSNSPSSALLQREEQNRIREQFLELFGFSGIFSVVPASDLQKNSGTQTDPISLPETILTEREREAEIRRKQIYEETANGLYVKEVLAVLGGKVEDIIIK